MGFQHRSENVDCLAQMGEICSSHLGSGHQLLETDTAVVVDSTVEEKQSSWRVYSVEYMSILWREGLHAVNTYLAHAPGMINGRTTGPEAIIRDFPRFDSRIWMACLC